jgi:hypothetical protein
LALWFDYIKRPIATLVCLFGALWVVAVGVQAFFIQEFDGYRVQADLARHANALAPPDVPIYLVELPENQITFYLRFPLARFDDLTTFVESVKEQTGSTHYLVTTPNAAERLTSFGTVTRLSAEVRRPKKRASVTALVFLHFAPAGLQEPLTDKP